MKLTELKFDDFNFLEVAKQNKKALKFMDRRETNNNMLTTRLG